MERRALNSSAALLVSDCVGLLAAFAPNGAFAIEFQVNKNHCEAGEFAPVNPLSGGKWGLIDSTAWAESGECVNFPIETLLQAAGDVKAITIGA